MKPDKRLLLLVLQLSVCAIVIAFCAYRLFGLSKAYKEAESEYEALAEIAFGGDDAPKDAAVTEKSKPAQSNSALDEVNFEPLRAINPDIIGWIKIDGTTIDYPIVQCGDNEKYLNTTFEGKTNSSGAIFMDFRNAPDLSDSNTFIYGHEMKNGAMFSPLLKYKEQSFYQEYPRITIYLPQKKYVCDIFSAYSTEGSDFTYTLLESVPHAQAAHSGYSEYIDHITRSSLISPTADTPSNERIVTLSTCDSSKKNGRMVVHAKLTEAP